MKIIKSIPLIFLSLFLFFDSYSKSFTLHEAVSAGLVEVKTHGMNSHTGQCIEMELVSLHMKDVELIIESGLILQAEDTTVQNMIITKGKTLTLVPKSQKKIALYALCIEQSDKGPQIEDSFSAGNLAEGNLLELVRYIETKNYHNDDAAQHAVWVLTDNANIAGIYSDNADVGKDLRLFMKKLTGIVPPWYQVEYQKEPGVVFTNKPATIHANFSYTLNEPGVITFAVYNEKGVAVQMIFEKKEMQQGIYSMKLDIEARHAEPGNYYVRIHNGEKLVEEKVFKL